MLRAVRFAAVLGFEVHPDTEGAVREHAGEIGIVSGERIRESCRRRSPQRRNRAGGARGRLFDYRLMGGVLPEAAAGVHRPRVGRRPGSRDRGGAGGAGLGDCLGGDVAGGPRTPCIAPG